MGRYYNTNNYYGKFGFAVQSSTDPEVFGMTEQDPTEVTYYIEEDQVDRVVKTLDEQYALCEVPQEERIYYVANDKELAEYVENHVEPRIYREEAPGDNVIPYGGFSKEFLEKHGFKSEHLVPKSRKMDVARFRILLGLRILSDLKRDGYCELIAEL